MKYPRPAASLVAILMLSTCAGGCDGGAAPAADARPHADASTSFDAAAAECTTAAQCDDDDACTSDACHAAGVGRCVHVAVAIDDANACTIDSCDPASGVTHLAAVIDDADACTKDTCDPLAGVDHVGVAVDDANACTIDFCDLLTGVGHMNVATGDGNACTTDTCDPVFGVSHTPVAISDANACTVDACNVMTGIITHTAPSVDDLNTCTVDACNPATGATTHVSISCDDGIACSADSCDAVLGCMHVQRTVNFSEDFSDNAAGWTLNSTWAIGPAVSACNDPGSDATPTNDNGVAGVVIGGCASVALHDFYYITSPIIDTSGIPGAVMLGFKRWLDSDYTPYMKNVVQVFDGQTWHTIWETFGTATSDQGWASLAYNVSAYKSASMRVRFGYAVQGNGALSVGSWSLDDVTVTATACP